MIVPVRCFTCGKVLANDYEEFISRMGKKEDPKKIFEDLGVKRYCCKRMLLSHVDLIDDIMKYNM